MKEFDLDEKGYLSICEKGAFDMVDAEIILTPNEVDELKNKLIDMQLNKIDEITYNLELGCIN